ncbi:MAG TPA: hypothetical protein VK281_10640 [Xanthobacteraceae bacterium]|nr:hypothetical protein [Xanthobacteraceae bacterium]
MTVRIGRTLDRRGFPAAAAAAAALTAIGGISPAAAHGSASTRLESNRG